MIDNLNLTVVTLRRTESNEVRTLGEMKVTDGERLCYTLELPWKDNQTDISCIPVGTYIVTWWNSPSKGMVFKVWNVPDRKDILIHVGNTPKDTEGCILPGLDQTPHDVGQSRLAMEKLHELFPDEAFILIVTAHDIGRG